jgi:hypothetical protein
MGHADHAHRPDGPRSAGHDRPGARGGGGAGSGRFGGVRFGGRPARFGGHPARFASGRLVRAAWPPALRHRAHRRPAHARAVPAAYVAAASRAAHPGAASRGRPRLGLLARVRCGCAPGPPRPDRPGRPRAGSQSGHRHARRPSGHRPARMAAPGPSHGPHRPACVAAHGHRLRAGRPARGRAPHRRKALGCRGDLARPARPGRAARPHRPRDPFARDARRRGTARAARPHPGGMRRRWCPGTIGPRGHPGAGGRRGRGKGVRGLRDRAAGRGGRSRERRRELSRTAWRRLGKNPCHRRGPGSVRPVQGGALDRRRHDRRGRGRHPPPAKLEAPRFGGVAGHASRAERPAVHPDRRLVGAHAGPAPRRARHRRTGADGDALGSDDIARRTEGLGSGGLRGRRSGRLRPPPRDPAGEPPGSRMALRLRDEQAPEAHLRRRPEDRTHGEHDPHAPPAALLVR